MGHEAGTVQARTVEARTVEAGTVEAGTVEAGTARARAPRGAGAAVRSATDAPVAPDGPDPVLLRTREQAEAYVATVCFKHGPPTLAGVELEWLLHSPATPDRPVPLTTVAAALGAHAPTAVAPGSPARPLPAGSCVTLEPGGQVELASPPLPGLGPLVAAVETDTAALHGMLAAQGLTPVPRSADAHRPPHRLLDLPRYAAMERYFDRIGPSGRSGMCSTAAVQVCLDAGEPPGIAERWAVLHDLGPVLLGAFANSPVLHGRHTGWKSSRMACWLTADPARTAPPAGDEPEPAAAWARRVLDTPLLCVRRDGSWDAPPRTTFAAWIDGALPGTPSTADLDYHVSTLFPPVRPRGHLEVRYVDGQAGRGWAQPLAALVALTSGPAVVDRVRELCAPARGRWTSAARHGLADRVVARAARDVFALACELLPGLDAPGWVVEDLVATTERQVARGRCPADDALPGEPHRTEGAHR